MKTRPVILVVEDDMLLRMAAVDIAIDAGFDGISVETADEAIVVLEQRSDVRLVFTDIHMPGSMDGMRLARAVRERWPPVELVVTSGHGNVRLADLPARGRFLAKPYDYGALTQTFREMVGNA